MQHKMIIWSGILSLMLGIGALGHVPMSQQSTSMGEASQRVIKSREEFENLAIKKVRGDLPDLLKGIWMEVPMYRVEVTVDAEGNVTDATPLYGNSLLAEAAISAARQWIFPRQRIHGKPVQVLSAVNVEFENLIAQERHGLLVMAKQKLEERPDFAPNYYNVGFAYQADHQYKEATEYYQKAIDEAPDWPVAHVALGGAYRLLDQYDRALDSFLRAARLKADYYEAHEGCGLVYTRLRRDEDALKSFLQGAASAKSVRDKLWAFRNLVTCYEALGKKEQAAEAQMQVARQASRYSVVAPRSPFDPAEEAFSAAVKYERVDNATGALAAYRFAMEIAPLSEPGLLARIMVAAYLRRENKQNQSTELLQEMLKIADDAIRDYSGSNDVYGLGSAYFWRGHAYHDLGRMQPALRDLRMALKYRPGWGQALLRLAYVYLKLGDFKSAQNAYRASGIVDDGLARELAKRGQNEK